MAARAVTALRVALALEFVGALVAWAVWRCPWPLAGFVATCALTAWMLSFDTDQPSQRRAT